MKMESSILQNEESNIQLSTLDTTKKSVVQASQHFNGISHLNYSPIDRMFK